jgi:hypothetical protein
MNKGLAVQRKDVRRSCAGVEQALGDSGKRQGAHLPCYVRVNGRRLLQRLGKTAKPGPNAGVVDRVEDCKAPASEGGHYKGGANSKAPAFPVSPGQSEGGRYKSDISSLWEDGED